MTESGIGTLGRFVKDLLFTLLELLPCENNFVNQGTKRL